MALQGGPASRAYIPDALEANLRKAIVTNFMRQEKFHEFFCNTNTTDKAVENDIVMAGLGLFDSVPEGAEADFDSQEQAWKVVHTVVKFGRRIGYTIEALADDIHGVFRKAGTDAKQLADVANYTIQVQSMYNINNRLTSGTVYTAESTNYSVLSTSHFLKNGATWSNRPTTAMDFSPEALEYMVGHWSDNQVNQRGQKSPYAPERLMVGANDWMLAKRTVASMHLPGSGGDGQPNVAGDMIRELKYNPHMTNDGRWLVFGPKDQTGWVHLTRAPLNVMKLPDGTNGNTNFYAFYREVSNMVHPHHTWGSP